MIQGCDPSKLKRTAHQHFGGDIVTFTDTNCDLLETVGREVFNSYYALVEEKTDDIGAIFELLESVDRRFPASSRLTRS